MSQYLPPGCGNTDPYDPRCGSCGCESSSHYETDNEAETPDPCSRAFENNFDIELDSNGEVAHACDSLISGIQCTCEGYVEGEYEPDIDEERMRYDDLD